MEHSKKTEAGCRERIAVLQRVYPDCVRVVENFFSQSRLRVVATDDLLDAFVLAVAAFLGQYGLRTLPEDPEVDSRGLRMEIVYPAL